MKPGKPKRKVVVKVLRPALAAVLGAERFVQLIETTAVKTKAGEHRSPAFVVWQNWPLARTVTIDHRSVQCK